MISRRHATPLALVLTVALLPTLRHGYTRFVLPAVQITPRDLPPTLGSIPGADRELGRAWMVNTYDADSWAQRTYALPGRGEFSLFVARGFDLKKLYHHPELGILRGHSFSPARRTPLDAAGSPVFVLEGTSSEDAAVYALLYEGQWVANPYMMQLYSAVTSLWGGRRPLTLVLVHGDVLVDGRPREETAALIRDAVRRLGMTAAEAERR